MNPARSKYSRRVAAWPTPSGMATSARSSASIATYSPAPPPLDYGAIPARPPCLLATFAQCAKAIRDHWHIENRSHYVRDGSFAEDASRIRRNPGIFARLRSFAANILRFNGIHNVSDGRHRIAFGGINAILGMRIMY